MRVASSNMYPANKIPITGGVGKIKESSILETDYNDDFFYDYKRASYPDGFWNISSTTKTAWPYYDTGDDRLKCALQQTGVSNFKMTGHSFSSGNPLSLKLAIDFGFEYVRPTTIGGTVTPFYYGIEGTGLEASLYVSYNDGWANPRLYVYVRDSAAHLAGDTYQYDFDGYRGEFRIEFYDDEVRFYQKTSSGLSLVHSDTWTVPVSTTLNTFIRAFDDGVASSSAGRILFGGWAELPVIDGLRDSSLSGLPVPLSSNTFAFSPQAPGSYTVTLYGTGSGVGSTETATLEIVEAYLKDEPLRFIVGQPTYFYDDTDGIFVCPTRSKPDLSNKGNLLFVNNCWCDGSDRDSDILNVDIKRYGEFTQRGNRKNQPEFFLRDELDNTFGCNFDFQRVHQNVSSSFDLTTPGDVYVFTKQLEMSDGKIVYYGVAAPAATASDVLADFTFNFSSTPTSDQFYWELFDEDGNSLDTPLSNPITSANYTNINNYQMAINLDPGRYILRMSTTAVSTIRSGATVTRGASFSCDVYQGSTTADPQIAYGFAESEYMPSAVSADYDVDSDGICDIHFEVKEPRGYIVAVVFDPCANTLTKYESATSDISLRSNSLIAFEDSNGDVVFVYDMATSDDLYGSERNQDFAYRVFDVSGGTFGSQYDLYLPTGAVSGNEYLWAFDGYKKDNFIYFFMSVADSSDYFYLETDSGRYERSVPYTPIGDSEIRILKWDATNINFDSDHFMRRFEITKALMPSIETMFAHNTEFVYGAELNYEKKLPFAYSIKARRNPGLEITTLALMDMNRKTPSVLMGNDLFFKEVYIPFHFGVWDQVDFTWTDPKTSLIDDFDAVLHNDGMIYSVATQDWLTEIGVLDPSLYWTAREQFILLKNKKGQESSRADRSYFEPDFGFRCYRILSPSAESGIDEITSVNIFQDYQYMTMIKGNTVRGYRPVIHKNNMPDLFPFETFSEHAMIPEYFENQTLWVDDGVSVALSSGKDYVRVTSNTSAQAVNTTLINGVTHNNKFYSLDEGYKFHARVLWTPQSGSTLATPLLISAEAIEGDAGFHACQARISIDGETADCQVWNEGSSSWETAGQFTNLVEDELWDFYILMKSTGDQSSIVTFVCKRTHNSDSLVLDYGFINDSVQVKHAKVTFDDMAYASDQTFFSVGFASALFGVNEVVDIYEMGYNTLRLLPGPYNVESISRNATPTDVYTTREKIGLTWRQFNDTELLGNDVGDPKYPYRSFKFENGNTGGYYHWFNGFKFRPAGRTAVRGDVNYLQRERIDFVNGILSQNLHGIFATQTYVSAVNIWADAQDNGLEKFSADMFVVYGSNVASVNIVGRDDSVDPWTTIGTIDFTKYQFNVLSYTIDGELVIVETDATWTDGMFEHQPFYYDDPNNVGYFYSKVVGCSGSSLILQRDSTDTDYAGSTGLIFTTRGTLELDEPTRYRYLGVQIPSSPTMEKRFLIENFDFGIKSVIPLEYNFSDGTDISFEMSKEVLQVEDNQPVSGFNKAMVKTFSLKYNITDAATYLKMISLLERMDMNRKTMWVVEDYTNRNELVYLCAISSFNHNVVIDEDGDKYYQVTVNLKAVKE